MKRLILIAAAALSLSACLANGSGGAGTLPTPGEIANRTVLDEKAGIASETVYTAANRAAALAIRTGIVTDTATIKRIGELDLQAKALLQKVRDAYTAGNAAGYDAAFRQLNTVATEILRLAK